ncbi:MAG: PAS domain S-box protein, partial [Deltaproteobacteria bacterium]|nr:PAS domain S-box protein [Deltaproteobacteria bacterium]
MLERPFSGESAGVKQGPGELDTSISLLTGSDELFNTFFMCSPIGLYIVQDGVFRLVNPKFEKEMGRGQHELVGREALSFVVPEHRDMVRRNAIEMLKGERTQPYEFIVATSNDERRWIMETVTSIQYHGRRATFGNFMDITDRKRAEEALRERQELHRAVVEQAAETICIVDVKTRLIIESNPAFRKLLGYDSVELQSMTLYDFIAHERSDIDQNIECIIGRGEHFLGERVWQRKDGSCVEMEVGANAISFAGRKALCVVARDLSDRKRAQKKRKFLMQRLLSVVEDERKRLGRDLHDELGSLLTALRFSLDALQVSISEADMQAP